jgi:hypothetical protein
MRQQFRGGYQRVREKAFSEKDERQACLFSELERN